VNKGDILTLDDGRVVRITDIPEGNEDAPEDLILVTENLTATLTEDSDPAIFVINPFQIVLN
jgi:hypothetical protein